MALTIDRPDYTAAELNGVWSNLISVLSPRLPYAIRVNSSGQAIDDLDISESDSEAMSILEPFDVMIALARKGQANGQGLWNAVYDQEVNKFRLDVRETVTINNIQNGVILFPVVEEPLRVAYVYLDEVSSKVFEYSSDKETTNTANGWTSNNLDTQEVFEGSGYNDFNVGESRIKGLVDDFEDYYNVGFTYFDVGTGYRNGQIEEFDVGDWPSGTSPSEGGVVYETIDISSQVDGTETTFVIPAYDTSKDINLRVYYNGQRLTTGGDVTISTVTTFSMTFAPVNGSELVVDYKPQ